MTIVPALVRQVMACLHSMPPGCNERDVRTYISRGMWRAFVAELGLPGGEPTEWKGKDTRRVYGSETIVIERPGMWSFSVPSNTHQIPIK